MMINFTRAFDLAWERMVVILFRPFDLGKWCVIGFSAFLAGLLSGGNGISTSYQDRFNRSSTTSFHVPFQEYQTGISNFFSGLQVGLAILAVALAFAVIVGLVLLVSWLGARGQFLLLDNIARNRPAIAAPWKYYAGPANQVFVLNLIFLALNLGILLLLLGPAALLALPLFQHKGRPQDGSFLGLVTLGVTYLLVAIALGALIFLFREWGIPLMFRNGISAKAALSATMDLIRRHPGAVVLFILLRLALWIGLAVLSLLTYCFSCCCLAVIPYIGTVVLLPALIYIRCFSLDCLAQFGPTFDVWTVDVAPPTATELPLSPPPPPG